MSTGSSEASPPPTPAELDDMLQITIRKHIESILKGGKGRKETSNKRPQDGDEDENSSSDSKTFGRIYGRQDDPFTNVDTIVNFGIRHETEEDEEEEDYGQALKEPSTSDKRLLHSWRLLLLIIPDFCTQMLGLAENRKARKATCQLIYQGVATVRADDTSSLKAWIPSYILINPNDSLVPAIAIRSKLKNDRGFYHPATASLLCPIRYPDTPETYADIKAGKLPLTATLLPRFLYPNEYVYDPTDVSNGLLCGHLMYRAAKHIFQGPSSALEEPGSHRGKRGNAALSGITSMSPRTIAYVATQVRFALSSATSWVAKDGTFSYKDFYWYIVELLEDEEDLENQETIKLYNYHVFGAQDPRGETDDDAVEVENEYDIIKKQRAAKRARLAQ